MGFEETFLRPTLPHSGLIQFVRGQVALGQQRHEKGRCASPLRSMGAILQDIKKLVASGKSSTIIQLILGAKDFVVVIDCITPVFLQPAADPVRFLGALLSLQRSLLSWGRR